MTNSHPLSLSADSSTMTWSYALWPSIPHSIKLLETWSLPTEIQDRAHCPKPAAKCFITCPSFVRIWEKMFLEFKILFFMGEESSASLDFTRLTKKKVHKLISQVCDYGGNLYRKVKIRTICNSTNCTREYQISTLSNLFWINFLVFPLMGWFHKLSFRFS